MLAGLVLTHLIDVTGVLLAGFPSKLPADAADQLQTFAHWPDHWAAVYAEVSVWDATMEQMRRALRGGVTDLPLTVITPPPTTPAWRSCGTRGWRCNATWPGPPTPPATPCWTEPATSLATEPEPIRTVIQAVHDMFDTISVIVPTPRRGTRKIGSSQRFDLDRRGAATRPQRRGCAPVLPRPLAMSNSPGDAAPTTDLLNPSVIPAPWDRPPILLSTSALRRPGRCGAGRVRRVSRRAAAPGRER